MTRRGSGVRIPHRPQRTSSSEAQKRRTSVAPENDGAPLARFEREAPSWIARVLVRTGRPEVVEPARRRDLVAMPHALRGTIRSCGLGGTGARPRSAPSVSGGRVSVTLLQLAGSHPGPRVWHLVVALRPRRMPAR